MYYVYEWFIKDTNEVIYVGKGTGRRYKVRKHNRLFNEMIKRFNCDSRIVKEFADEAKAFDYEFVRIKELQKQGQCVCNIRDGGFGGTTEWWTDELRRKYSEQNVMKSENQRKRMSEHNPMKNKEIACKTNSQKNRVVIIGNREYPSIKIACEELGVCYDVIATWCRKGINSKGERCRFKDSPQVEFTDKRYNKCGSRAVVYQGIRYECVKDFANDVGISMSTALSWLRRGFNPQAIPCRYEDNNKSFVFENRYVVRNKAKANPVIINNIEYRTCEEASRILGIPKSTIYSYLQGKKKNPKYICKYGNQQPSRENTSDSIPEGSTTNK